MLQAMGVLRPLGPDKEAADNLSSDTFLNYSLSESSDEEADSLSEFLKGISSLS